MKNISQLSNIINPVVAFLKRYVTLIFIITLCVVYGFLAYRINTLTNADPTAEAVAEKLDAVTRPRIDQNAIDKMLELEEENIEIKALFDEARKNPFTE